MRTLAERTAVATLETIGRRLWGFPPNLMPAVVDRLGAVGSLSWFAQNMPRYERTRSALGPLRVHLLCVEISLLNGCPYCTFGHAYAFQLLYLAERNELFPLDEHALLALRGEGEAALRRALSEALTRAELSEEIAWFDRLLSLRDGSLDPSDADDARLLHLLEMFAVLNACGIESRAVRDQAHDPINKQRELVERYQALRAAERTPGTVAAGAE